MKKRLWLSGLCMGSATAAALVWGCGSSDDTNGSQATDAGGNDGFVDAGSTDGNPAPDAKTCNSACSADGTSVVDCNGKTVQACAATSVCDPTTVKCANACAVAANAKGSVGCDFYATDMEVDPEGAGFCFAAYVVNGSASAVHIGAAFGSTTYAIESFARIPSGTGPSLTYDAYDADAGLAPGKAAVLFLSDTETSGDPCPIAPAVRPTAEIAGTGKGNAFHITTDVPVSAYEINPYGGEASSLPGASLLLPTAAWGTNYLAITAAPFDVDPPSFNVVASADNTTVTILPDVAIAGGGTFPAGAANTPYTFTLNKGEHAQLSQTADLLGSILQATAPVGLMAGNGAMRIPSGVAGADHGEQMIPPVQAAGHEYVATMHRPRIASDAAIWQMVGLVDGTTLTYSTATDAGVGGSPTSLNASQSATFTTATPFAVSSQDSAHPFFLFEEMSGAQALSDMSGYGDPDFVYIVPPEQFETHYSFVADPNYPENDLVVVRAKDAAGNFDDVTLDCAGVIAGWQSVGNYEWTRVDLVSGNFVNQGSCSAGAHNISSNGPFGATMWGWGTANTTTTTGFISYGYPVGMNVTPRNSVVLATTPH